MGTEFSLFVYSTRKEGLWGQCSGIKYSVTILEVSETQYSVSAELWTNQLLFQPGGIRIISLRWQGLTCCRNDSHELVCTPKTTMLFLLIVCSHKHKNKTFSAAFWLWLNKCLCFWLPLDRNDILWFGSRSARPVIIRIIPQIKGCRKA